MCTSNSFCVHDTYTDTSVHAIFQALGGEVGDYGKDFIKIKFNSDDNLPLNKTLKIHNMTIVIRSVFQEDGKYYPQEF